MWPWDEGCGREHKCVGKGKQCKFVREYVGGTNKKEQIKHHKTQ